MDISREELDRLVQRARELGFTNVPNVRVLGPNTDGREVIALDYPRGRRPPPRADDLGNTGVEILRRLRGTTQGRP